MLQSNWPSAVVDAVFGGVAAAARPGSEAIIASTPGAPPAFFHVSRVTAQLALAASARLRKIDAALPTPSMAEWRLKFLHKVGVADGASSHEHAAASRAAPPPPPSREGTSQGKSAAQPSGSQARSQDDIRMRYIEKLERSRAFIPQLSRPKTAQTVTIFDWDDTLLCTTHLEMLQRQHGAIPAQARATAPRRAPFKQPP